MITIEDSRKEITILDSSKAVNATEKTTGKATAKFCKKNNKKQNVLISMNLFVKEIFQFV